MHEKTSTIPVEGRDYQIRKMTPDVGGYIWQKLMQACFKARSENAVVDAQEDSAAEEAAKKRSVDVRMRGICAVAFMHLTLPDYRLVQNSCMKVLSRMENEQPMPVMADSGQWAAPDIAENPFLVTKLMTEVLVFNLSSFLS